MGFLDPGKILVILVIALVVLGPERLPRAARQLGAAWRELTKVRDQVTEEIRSAMPDVDLPNIPRMPKNVVSGFIADLTRPGTVEEAGGTAAGAGEVHSDFEEVPSGLVAASGTGDDPVAVPAPARPSGRRPVVDLQSALDDPSMN